MFGILAIVLAAVPSALAQSCLQQTYSVIPSFVEPNACVPNGYFQAQDLGNTNPSDLTSRCETQCTAYGTSCTAFVGQLWKAADSNLYSGQCFYYGATSVPTTPRVCVDHPTVIVGELKRTILKCLTSSPSAASVFCSSYLGIPAVTVYTRTSTPLTTSTSLSVATVSSTTTKTSSTTTTTTSVTTSTTTVTGRTTTTSVQITTSATTTTQLPFRKRDRAPTPECLRANPAPSSDISSACSCLSIPRTTVSSILTAATSTSVLRSTSTTFSTKTASSIVTLASTQLSTLKVTTTESKTDTTVSTSTVFTTSVLTCIPLGQTCIFQQPEQCCSQTCACTSGVCNCFQLS